MDFASQEGFWPNLLAEFAGIAVGAAIGVTLLERVLDRRRKEQWRQVRLAISLRLANTAIDFANELRRAVPEEQRQRFAEPPDPPDTASRLRQLADEFDLAGGAPASSEPARVLRHHLTLAQRSVMKAVARLEAAEAEPELVESMHRLEDALIQSM